MNPCTEPQLEELRQKKISWYTYCQARLTMNHADAVTHCTPERYRPENTSRMKRMTP